MKSTGKRILSALLFGVVLLVLIRLCSGLFVPKDNTEEDGIQDARVYGILGEPENTLDVLVLGDSLGECAISPMDIWREQGITAYTCCSGNQKLYETVDLLRMVLKHQNPGVVLLEANTIYSTCPKTDILSDTLNQVFPVFQYHDRWKTLQAKDWLGKTDYTYTDESKGFHISREIKPTDTDGYMEFSEDVEPIRKENVLYVRWLAQICRKNGIQLILFSAPSTSNWNYPQHNGTAALAEELDLTYLDLNLMQEEVPIDWEQDTMDWGNHMNCSGAVKVSHYMSKYLTELGLFTDKRGNADYAAWDAGVAIFDENVANWVKKAE